MNIINLTGQDRRFRMWGGKSKEIKSTGIAVICRDESDGGERNFGGLLCIERTAYIEVISGDGRTVFPDFRTDTVIIVNNEVYERLRNRLDICRCGGFNKIGVCEVYKD